MQSYTILLVAGRVFKSIHSPTLRDERTTRGLSSFLLAEKGPFPLLRINPIISRGLMPVFEESESIVSTFPAQILVLIIVVLD